MPDTSSLDDLLTQGDVLLRAGDRARALTGFREALRMDPRNARAWLGLAKSTDDREETLEALGQVIALEPGNIEARNLRLSMQVGDLRAGIPDKVRTYRDNPFERIGTPLLVLAALVLAALIIYLERDAVAAWYTHTFAAVQVPIPTIAAASMPATWTPVPTIAPTPLPGLVAPKTPRGVIGRIDGPVSARSGPGTGFPIVGLFVGTVHIGLKARSQDGSYFQVQPDNYDRPVWVAAAFVDLTGSSISGLPVVSVPTPAPGAASAAPVPVPVPPPGPTAQPGPQSTTFHLSKNKPNPSGPRCDRTFIHGTVWNDVSQEPQGGLAGLRVWVWVKGVVVAGDVTGSQKPAGATPGYWQVDFPIGRAISGQVGVVGPDGKSLSPQYPFALGDGNCQDAASINEVLMDFSH